MLKLKLPPPSFNLPCSNPQHGIAFDKILVLKNFNITCNKFWGKYKKEKWKIRLEVVPSGFHELKVRQLEGPKLERASSKSKSSESTVIR